MKRAILLEAVENGQPLCKGVMLNAYGDDVDRHFMDRYNDPGRNTVRLRENMRIILKGTMFCQGNERQFLKPLNFQLHEDDQDCYTSDRFRGNRQQLRGDAFVVRLYDGSRVDLTEDDLMLVYRATHGVEERR